MIAENDNVLQDDLICYAPAIVHPTPYATKSLQGGQVCQFTWEASV